MSSAICFNLDQSEIFSSGNGLKNIHSLYQDALVNFDGGERKVVGELGTAGIWSTYPQNFVTTWNCFGDQVTHTVRNSTTQS